MNFTSNSLSKLWLPPDPKLNEDEFLAQFPEDIQLFFLEHIPYPIPKYLLKVDESKNSFSARGCLGLPERLSTEKLKNHTVQWRCDPYSGFHDTVNLSRVRGSEKS